MFIYCYDLSLFCLFVCLFFSMFLISKIFSSHCYRSVVQVLKKSRYFPIFFCLPLKNFSFFLWVIAWFLLFCLFFLFGLDVVVVVIMNLESMELYVCNSKGLDRFIFLMFLMEFFFSSLYPYIDMCTCICLLYSNIITVIT